MSGAHRGCFFIGVTLAAKLSYEILIAPRRVTSASDECLIQPVKRPGMGQARVMSEVTTSKDGLRVIREGVPEFGKFGELVQRALRLSSEIGALSTSPQDADAVRALFTELTGKPVHESFSLYPPFTADWGPNITVGETVFVNQYCMFLGHGAITIGDRVMVGPRVTILTAGHPVEPERRRGAITSAPVTIGDDVWIGAAATIVPGVTIGRHSVVAAGAVVTRDVPPRTLVGGIGDRHPRAVSELAPTGVRHYAPARSESRVL